MVRKNLPHSATLVCGCRVQVFTTPPRFDIKWDLCNTHFFAGAMQELLQELEEGPLDEARREKVRQLLTQIRKKD